MMESNENETRVEHYVSPPQEAIDEWKSHATSPYLSAEAAKLHAEGKSYVINCNLCLSNSDVPLFFSKNMHEMLMVGIDGYTIAPNDMTLVFSHGQKGKRFIRWITRVLA